SLKVRQPLSSLQVQFQDKADGQFLAGWMQDLICSELNVLSVSEVPTLITDDKYKTQSSVSLAVGLNTVVTPELKQQGILREVIRSIQALRKQTGLEMGDKASITYFTPDTELRQIISSGETEIKEAVNALALIEGQAETEVKINEFKLNLSIEK
ncbi:hypothetical protein KC640_03055, partial [Candidatus Dojkabacteria bacterium]|nr:hypothetical protein [Candidatus Dojkabacteria bacterium]